MNFNLHRATRPILLVALALPALSIAGCGNSKPDETAVITPPAMSAADKQKMDEKRQKDEETIKNLPKN